MASFPPQTYTLETYLASGDRWEKFLALSGNLERKVRPLPPLFLNMLEKHDSLSNFGTVRRSWESPVCALQNSEIACPSLSSGSSSDDEVADENEEFCHPLEAKRSPAALSTIMEGMSNAGEDEVERSTEAGGAGQGDSQGNGQADDRETDRSRDQASEKTSPKQGDEGEADASTATSSSGPDVGEQEPAIYNSVRTILAGDPAYAGAVIRAISRLPEHQRNILLSPASADDIHTPSVSTEETDGHTDGAERTRQGSSSSGQDQRGAHSQGRGVSSLSPARGSSKNGDASSHGKRSRDPNDDSEREDDNNDDGGNGHSAAKQMKTGKHNRRWICPFRHAFPSIDRISKFNTCRLFGNLTNRKKWKDHLKTAHSPIAAANNRDTEHARYYLSEEQWTQVHHTFERAAAHRPRNASKKLDADTKCFVDVWRLIFPKNRYAELTEPSSPFVPEHHTLEEQSTSLFDVMLSTRAEMAVDRGTIAAGSDFRPSHEEYMDMLRDAFTVVARMSESMSRSITESSNERIEAAVRSLSGPTVAVAAANLPGATAKTVGQDTHAAESRPPSELSKPKREKRENVAVIPLQWQQTEVCLQLATTDCQPELRVIVPPATFLRGCSQKPDYGAKGDSVPDLTEIRGGTTMEPYPPPTQPVSLNAASMSFAAEHVHEHERPMTTTLEDTVNPADLSMDIGSIEASDDGNFCFLSLDCMLD